MMVVQRSQKDVGLSAEGFIDMNKQTIVFVSKKPKMAKYFLFDIYFSDVENGIFILHVLADSTRIE